MQSTLTPTAPGAAGTLQEIFQDLCQNHYATYGLRSPMILFGKQHYQAEYSLLTSFAVQHKMDQVYGDLIALLDQEDEVLAFLESHPPRNAQQPEPLYQTLLPGDSGRQLE